MSVPGWIPWYQGSWGQHGAHLGPTGPRWVPWWHHELCYLGTHTECVELMEPFYIIVFFLILLHLFSHWFFDERDALRTMVSNFMLIWRHWTYEMPVRYFLLSVWVRLSILSLLSIIQYVGLYAFSLPISLVMIERIYILCLIIIIKSEVWTNTHCLGLGHKTMVSAVCLSIFLCISFIFQWRFNLIFGKKLLKPKYTFMFLYKCRMQRVNKHLSPSCKCCISCKVPIFVEKVIFQW